MGTKESSHTPAINRAVDVIELMAASDTALSLSELMRQLGIPRQSLIRILNTLCDRGILNRGPQRGYYQLGMKLLYLGNRLQDKINLRSVGLSHMQKLAQKTRKTIELSTLDRDQLLLIEQVEGSEGVRLFSRVGAVYPYFHAVAVGKVYLAHMRPEKMRSVLHKIGLPAVTAKTITKIETLEAELAEVRKNGYAFEDQELRKGIRRVAAPIYEYRDDLAGCIGIAAPVFSFEMKNRAELGHMIVQTAARISQAMGRWG